ncbi:MAG: amidase [Gemmatimonadota bacterium]|nr:amidase [Gemmatimonadota bacterium]
MDRPKHALHFLTATELAGMYRGGQVSPVAVTEAYLERIHRYQPGTNAFITVTADRARADAEAAERALRSGNDFGPLHGVPIALKDLCDTAGIRTTSGALARQDCVPATSSTVAKRLARAGTVLLGKTNLVEYAFGPFGINPHFGTPPNPWDPERVPGGSSSGSGLAVAAGLAAAAIGTDTGGSVRIPAAYCGVVGLKTTAGRIGTGGVMPLSWTLDTIGPMARCVEDAALMYVAIAGAEAGDATAHDLPVGDVMGDLKKDVRGLRLAVVREPFFNGADPEVVSLVDDAIQVLGSLGANVREMTFPEAVQAERDEDNLRLLRTEAVVVHREALTEAPDSFGSDVRARLQVEPGLLAVDLAEIQRKRAEMMRTAAARLADVEAVAGPTMLSPAPRLRDLDRGEPHRLLTRLVNWLGLCAVSVPCGFTSQGLPVGLQLTGKPHDEATILRLAYAYEQATDWRAAHPPDYLL